jgi:hypothetical protein
MFEDLYSPPWPEPKKDIPIDDELILPELELDLDDDEDFDFDLDDLLDIIKELSEKRA